MALLTVNDDVTLPGTIVIVDVQTVDVEDKTTPNAYTRQLRCWSAIAGRIEGDKWTREKQCCSVSAEKFWSLLNSWRVMHRPTWVFASNCSTALTLLGLWQLMESGEFSLFRRPTQQLIEWRARNKKRNPEKVETGLLIDNGPPTVVVFYHKSGWKVIALDSANYFGSSTAISANSQEKLSIIVPGKSAPIANWLAYSIERCGELREKVVALALWHRKAEMGRFAFTTGGIALAGFRHRFMQHSIDLPEDQDVRDWQRTGFYQGRVEAFWLGSMESGNYVPLAGVETREDLFSRPPPPPYYLLDARSMYGAVYQFCRVPVACVESSADSSYDAPDLSEDGADCIATVELDTPHAEFPVRVKGRTLFATGQFQTTLAGPELHRAVTDRLVTRWLRWERYDLQLAFRSFSIALWNERVKFQEGGNLTASQVMKLSVASLWGKFLQRASRWENRPEVFATEPYHHWWDKSATDGTTRHFRSVAWDVQEEVDAGDAPHCFPAIAAFVTSYAREWLRTWRQIAGERNVLYVATDSLIVTEEGKHELEKAGICGDHGIGSLRVVQTCTDIRIRGIANLDFGAKRVRGGRRTATQGDVAPGCQVEECDSLATVLFVRRGQAVKVRKSHQSEEGFSQWQTIRPGGWLEAPALHQEGVTCSPS